MFETPQHPIEGEDVQMRQHSMSVCIELATPSDVNCLHMSTELALNQHPTGLHTRRELQGQPALPYKNAFQNDEDKLGHLTVSYFAN
mmetsp:Transcript_140949/g.243577  ORF Transcript_140949/g.243577 Transcript_140949/m.243577 type:complete len:87 (-) Transcript_140949:1728-1988(-)